MPHIPPPIPTPFKAPIVRASFCTELDEISQLDPIDVLCIDLDAQSGLTFRLDDDDIAQKIELSHCAAFNMVPTPAGRTTWRPSYKILTGSDPVIRSKVSNRLAAMKMRTTGPDESTAETVSGSLFDCVKATYWKAASEVVHQLIQNQQIGRVLNRKPRLPSASHNDTATAPAPAPAPDALDFVMDEMTAYRGTGFFHKGLDIRPMYGYHPDGSWVLGLGVDDTYSQLPNAETRAVVESHLRPWLDGYLERYQNTTVPRGCDTAHNLRCTLYEKLGDAKESLEAALETLSAVEG